MKMFKSKRVNKKNIFRILFLLLISFLIAKIIYKFNIINLNIIKNISVNKIPNNIININNNYLLSMGLNTNKKIKFTTKTIIKDNTKSKYKIYIYNTHQTEEYAPIELYNLTPTVLTASYILKDYLKEYNIDVLVEERSLIEELKNNNLNYNKAYYVSEDWLKDVGNDYDLYIDLHRDSIKYDQSNIIIDNKEYAKILFVVGKDDYYDNTDNLNLANKLNEYITNIKDISRGVLVKKSSFNQDFNKNCLLIEIGGVESNYESISNTLNVLGESINKLLDGIYGRN